MNVIEVTRDDWLKILSFLHPLIDEGRQVKSENINLFSAQYNNDSNKFPEIKNTSGPIKFEIVNFYENDSECELGEFYKMVINRMCWCLYLKKDNLRNYLGNCNEVIKLKNNFGESEKIEINFSFAETLIENQIVVNFGEKIHDNLYQKDTEKESVQQYIISYLGGKENLGPSAVKIMLNFKLKSALENHFIKKAVVQPEIKAVVQPEIKEVKHKKVRFLDDNGPEHLLEQKIDPVQQITLYINGEKNNLTICDIKSLLALILNSEEKIKEYKLVANVSNRNYAFYTNIMISIAMNMKKKNLVQTLILQPHMKNQTFYDYQNNFCGFFRALGFKKKIMFLTAVSGCEITEKYCVITDLYNSCIKDWTIRKNDEFDISSFQQQLKGIFGQCIAKLALIISGIKISLDNFTLKGMSNLSMDIKDFHFEKAIFRNEIIPNLEMGLLGYPNTNINAIISAFGNPSDFIYSSKLLPEYALVTDNTEVLNTVITKKK